MRYAYEVRKADEHFEDIPDIKVPDEMLKLAEHILETKTADFDPSQFKDHYEEALVELLRKKQSNIPITKDKEQPAPRNVINLMDALRRSIQVAGGSRRSRRKQRRGSRDKKKCCSR